MKQRDLYNVAAKLLLIIVSYSRIEIRREAPAGCKVRLACIFSTRGLFLRDAPPFLVLLAAFLH